MSIIDTTWDESNNGYPEPTVITIDENTDMSKIHELATDVTDPIQKKIRRSAVGIVTFKNQEEFLEWQQEEPREIFEITPTVNGLTSEGENRIVIFVTYNLGVIE